MTSAEDVVFRESDDALDWKVTAKMLPRPVADPYSTCMIRYTILPKQQRTMGAKIEFALSTEQSDILKVWPVDQDRWTVLWTQLMPALKQALETQNQIPKGIIEPLLEQARDAEITVVREYAQD
jgi:hypothetical protein